MLGSTCHVVTFAHSLFTVDQNASFLFCTLTLELLPTLSAGSFIYPNLKHHFLHEKPFLNFQNLTKETLKKDFSKILFPGLIKYYTHANV